MSSLGLSSLEAKRLERYAVEDIEGGVAVLPATAVALGGLDSKGNDGKGDAETVKPGESVTLVRADAVDVEAGAAPPAYGDV